MARTGDPGTFTNPNCASGIGAPFCDGTSPTVLQTLRNDAAATIDGQLRSHLEAQLPAASEIVTEIVQALQASGADLTDGGGSVAGGHYEGTLTVTLIE